MSEAQTPAIVAEDIATLDPAVRQALEAARTLESGGGTTDKVIDAYVFVGSRKIFRKKVFNTAPRLSKRHTECLPIK